MSKRVVIAVLILVLFVLVSGESVNCRLNNPFVLSDTPSKYWISIEGGSMYPGKYFSLPPDYPLPQNADDLKDRIKHIFQGTLYVDGKVSVGVYDIWKHFGLGLAWEWENLMSDMGDIYLAYTPEGWLVVVHEYKISGILNINYLFRKHFFRLGFEYTNLKVVECKWFNSGYSQAIEYIDGIGLGFDYRYYFVSIELNKMRISPFIETQISNSWLLPYKSIYKEYYPSDYHIMTAGVRLGLQFGVF